MRRQVGHRTHHEVRSRPPCHKDRRGAEELQSASLRGQEGTEAARRFHRLCPGLRRHGHEGLGACHRRGERPSAWERSSVRASGGSRRSRRNTPSSSRAAPGEFPLSPSRPSSPISLRDRFPSDTGPRDRSAVTVTACAAGTSAIGDAFRAIQGRLCRRHDRGRNRGGHHPLRGGRFQRHAGALHPE